MKTWFLRMKQALSVRLLTLKHKIPGFAAHLHARKQQAGDWLKETWLIVKCALLIFWIKVQMALSPEAMKGYWQWLKNLPGQFTRENFQKWSAAFLAWLKTLPETLKGLRKSSVLASLLLFALFVFMGHSATTAWLTYTTPVKQNSFQIGEMNLSVKYKNDKTGKFVEMTEDSSLFNDEALYEPGYTQVVYLHVKNDGNVEFDYKVTVKDFISEDSISVNETTLHLPDYLWFGVATADTEPELIRETARMIAQKNMADYTPLGQYSQNGRTLDGGEDQYVSLVVYMPEHIGNEANYKQGARIPSVTLGVTVYAQQAGTPMLQ